MSKPLKYTLKKAQAERVAFDWGELHWYANAQAGNSNAMTVGMCIIKPGEANGRHSHPNCSEILVVEKGSILHSIEDTEVEMGEGDVISIEAGVVHNARNIGGEDARLFICFSSADRETVGE